MPNYYYKCPQCEHTYNENRSIEQPQFFTHCFNCKDIEYVEVTE